MLLNSCAKVQISEEKAKKENVFFFFFFVFKQNTYLCQLSSSTNTHKNRNYPPIPL